MFLTEWIRRRNILIGLVVGCAWLFAMPAPVQAQDVLVSNITKGDNGATWPRTRLLHAQGFRTGSTPTVLASIAVRLSTRRTSNQSFPDMTLHRGSPHSRAIATLTRPRGTVSSSSTENYSYTATANVSLSASTTYYVVLTSQRGSQVSPHNTRSTGTNAAASGWSMNDRRRWKPINLLQEYLYRPNPIMIAVSGTSAVAFLNISDTAGREGQPVTLTAKLSKSVATAVTVKWRIVPGTATVADYTPRPDDNTLTIATGQTSATLEVFLTDDARHENPESFSVELYDATGATLARSRATVTINTENQHRKVGVDVYGVEEREHIDRDFPRVTLEVINYNVREVGLPRYQGEFTVRLDQKNISDVGDFTVGIYTVDGTAKSPEDFGYLVRGLTFPKGELTYHDIEISVVNDTLIEGPETFELRVGRPTLAGTHRFGLQAVHTFTILSDAADSEPIPPPVVAPVLGPEGADLVSNLNTTGAGNSTSTRNFSFHQEFTTGSHPGGYKLTRVRYQLVGSQPGNRFSSWIRQGTREITRLSESHGRQALTLLTPQNKETVLSAGTTYRLAFWTPDTLTSRVTRSGSDTGLTDWSIANTWAGSSTYSLQFKIQGAPVVAAPANLRAAIAGNDIGIAWDRIANELTGIPFRTGTGYEVQYCDTDCGDDGAGWTHLASTKVNEHPDTGAAAKLYRQGMDGRSYRVRVFNGLNWPFSNVVRVTPPAAVSGCQAPNLSGRDAIWSGTMDTGTGKVTTSSFDGGNTTAAGYSSSNSSSMLSNRDFNIGSNRYRINSVLATDDGLLKVTFANNTKLTLAEKEVLRLHDCRKSGQFEKDSYDFQTAIGKNGTYWWFTRPGWRVSSERTLYLSLPNDRTPASVNNFSAYPENHSVLLRWNLPTSWPPATKFRYRYSEGETVSADARWHDIPDGDDVGSAQGDEWQYLVRGLTNGTQYAFHMQGVNERGAGDTGGVLTVTPIGAGSSSEGDDDADESLESPEAPVTPFIPSFSRVPAEHDGSSKFSIRFHLNEEPDGLSFRTVHNGLFDVTGGTIVKAKRLTQGQNNGWHLDVVPSGFDDVILRVKETTDCTTTPGVCTADGRMLPGGLTISTAGPATLAVADVTVEEAADATLAFIVTMSKARYVPTTVRYATSDGSAASGSDYTSTSGTLTFNPLSRTQTIAVPVLDDAIDEGSETMTLTLSNPSANVLLADATATGTITNNDPLQRAWLSRFGRTVGTHVTDAIGDRFRDTPGQGNHVTIGGYRLDKSESNPLDTLAETLVNSGADGLPSRNMRDVLLGSSFRLNFGRAGGGMNLTAWGRVAGTEFSGKEGNLDLDGNVITGTVGIDGTWDRLLVGLALAHSQADGSYDGSDSQGDLDQTLTSLHPYVRYAFNDRMNAWGMMGYGRGELTLEHGTTAKQTTDTDFLMGSLGGRGVLFTAEQTGGVEIAMRTDAMFTQTESDALSATAGNGGNLAGAEGAAHRWRLILESSGEIPVTEERTLTPTMEIGMRHDWGDAETGFGLEMGARLKYVDTRLGLTIEGAVRGLLAHEDEDYTEWGASGSVRLAPGDEGQGLALTLAPSWGPAASGVNGLWNRQTTSGLARNTGTQSGQLNAEVGYGLPLDTGLLTPYAGTVFSDGSSRTYRVGTRWQLATGMTLNLEGLRQDQVGETPPDHGVRLQADWTF